MSDSIISTQQLKQFIERVENLEADKVNILSDIKEVYAEAKANGFDIKIMRQVIKLRKMEKDKLAEQEALLDLYRDALGV
ncbi:MAG: hypothetical protein K0Q51_1485 [Rickettsiaceae bacterium]|jgi:uncharacterized protein (UPF0335 family)|nr:hypothetical protein [Rickettsiaceae bacterium]